MTFTPARRQSRSEAQTAALKRYREMARKYYKDEVTEEQLEYAAQHARGSGCTDDEILTINFGECFGWENVRVDNV